MTKIREAFEEEAKRVLSPNLGDYLERVSPDGNYCANSTRSDFQWFKAGSKIAIEMLGIGDKGE